LEIGGPTEAGKDSLWPCFSLRRNHVGENFPMSCRKSLTAVVEHREPMDGDTFVATTDLLANLIDDILLSILEYLPKASLTGTA
jgi:hypothetical protein